MSDLLRKFPNESPEPYPVDGNSLRIRLEDGRELFDACTGVTGFAVLGYSHPQVLAAMKAQMDRYCHLDMNCWGNRTLDELAALLLSQAPDGFLQRLKRGEPLVLNGDGGALRDFIFVGDIVEAFVRGAESDFGRETYNLGGGSTRSVRELAELFGGDIECAEPREGEPPVICADIAKIQADLNWRPTTSLDEGIALTRAAYDL